MSTALEVSNLKLSDEIFYLLEIAPLDIKKSIKRIYFYLESYQKLSSLEYLTAEHLESYLHFRVNDKFLPISLSEVIKEIKDFILLFTKVFPHYPPVNMNFSIKRYTLWSKL